MLIWPTYLWNVGWNKIEEEDIKNGDNEVWMNKWYKYILHQTINEGIT